MNRLKTTFFYVSLFLPVFIYSQAQVGLKTVNVQGESRIDESRIEALAYQLLNSETDGKKKELNNQLKSLLIQELNKEEARSHPFSEIKSLSILSPSDSTIRIFNWNIPYSNGMFDFECGILHLNPTKDTAFKFLTAADKDSVNENYISPSNHWVPGLIYEVIENKTQFNTYYTLLVWDGHNILTNKKRIEVLWLDKNQNARFGAPIFVSNQAKNCRKIFEYGNDNKMRLYFDSLNHRIVYDHLSPSKPNLEGIYEYYGADLSFDAYQWNGKYWRYNADVDADLGSQKKKKDFKIDKDDIKKNRTFYKSN